MPAPAPTQPAPAPVPGLNRFEVECAGCGRIEYTATPELPDGWSTGEQAESDYAQAFCADCTDGVLS